MKKNEKHVATDQGMRKLADDFENTSREANETECEKAWMERMGCCSLNPSQHNYAAQGVFDDLLTYLASRRKDMESGYCSPRLFRSAAHLTTVLTQDFGFTYEAYEWNGISNDPDDDDAFDITVAEGCIEPEASNKERVVKALKDYLMVGAAKAKQVNSDAYLIWREALIECVFVYHNFAADAKEEEVNAFLAKIQKAAQITWADIQIDQQMKLLTRPPMRVKKGH